MSIYKTIDDLDVSGKRVLLRADLNVPMKDGKVTNTNRIDRTVPTIKELMSKGAIVIVMSHLGRPDGEVDMNYSLKPVAEALSKSLGSPVKFIPNSIGQDAIDAVSKLNAGEVAILENLRFNKGETKNDPAFVEELAKLGDIYVSDAFSTSHRAHASTEGLAHKLPCAAGRLMETEITALSNALDVPKRPVLAVVGGAKVSTKLGILHNLVKKVDYLVVGGAMANTFLNAEGIDVTGSLYEADMAIEAKEIMDEAKSNNCKLILPIDVVCGKDLKEGTETLSIDVGQKIPEGFKIFDVGIKSIAELEEILQTVKTVLWNGPLGAFEIKPFDNATNVIAREVARLSKEGKVLSVAGGGDTVSALQNANADTDFSYVSTAGGAFLEWIEGIELPGVAVLRR